MSGWGGGYVTDITYMTGYYRHQSPAMMTLACLLGGVASPMPGPDDPVSYLELGCGQGFGALVLAASNPHWKVTAIDFNPAHIAAARAWAAEAGIDNITFLEADLSTLAEDPGAAGGAGGGFRQPAWGVELGAVAVQAGIVRLLRTQGEAGRRRACQLQRAAGLGRRARNAAPAARGRSAPGRAQRPPGRGGAQAGEGSAAADALQLIRSPWVNALIERLANMPASTWRTNT